MSRWKINEDARKVLEEQYLRKRFPSPTSKKRLADELDVAPRRIQVWFQNRRQREKAVDDAPEPAPRSGHAAANVPSLHSSMDDDEFDSFDEPWGGFYQPGMAAQGPPRSTPDGTSSLLGAAMNNFVYALDPNGGPSSVQTQPFDGVSCGRPWDPRDVGAAPTVGDMNQMPVSFLSSSDDIFQALMGFEDEHQKAKLAGLMSMAQRPPGSAVAPAPSVAAAFGSKADLASLEAMISAGKRKMPPDFAELAPIPVRPSLAPQPADAASGAAEGGAAAAGSSPPAGADAAAALSALGAAPALPPGSECTTNEILKQLNNIHQQRALAQAAQGPMCASAPTAGSGGGSGGAGGGGSSGGDGAAPQPAMRLASITPGIAGGGASGLPQPPQPPPALHPPNSAMVASSSHQGPTDFDGVGDESRRMLQAHYQQMHRGEIDSWVTAADAVNAVLDTARKQYALAVKQPKHHGTPVQSNIPPVSAFPSAGSGTPHAGMAAQHRHPVATPSVAQHQQAPSSLAQLMPPQQQQALQQLLRSNLPYTHPHPSLPH